MEAQSITKSIIITGPGGSGKSTRAKEIAEGYSQDEVLKLWSFGRRVWENNKTFSQCTEKTKLVIIEEVLRVNDIIKAHNFISSGIMIKPINESSYYIYPKVIIVCDEKVKPEKLANYKLGLEVIQCKK